MNTATAHQLPPPATLARFDVPGPRYTSYPTADRFHEGFGPGDYTRALQRWAAEAPAAGNTASSAAGRKAEPSLALYVHLPFCSSVCYYCACNKVVTRDRSRGEEYLAALGTEIALHAQALQGSERRFSQLHFGGGTPTFHDDGQLAQLVRLLDRSFAWTTTSERAIEIDPRTVDARRLAALADMGFNRASFGVQDFDPAVQTAVHREQPFEAVAQLMDDARRIGFGGINVDLIYGLPQQNTESFARTLAQVVAIRPDRVALYAYAHLPARFKPQRRIDTAALPVAAQKTAMLSLAIETLLAQGYEYIGMDHFALAGDTLAQAKRGGTLQRNFQGYTAQPDGDLIGLGVSAIGRVGHCYAQNEKTLPEYYAALREGRFATARGLTLSADDLLRRDLIMALMCQGHLDFSAIAAQHAQQMGRATFGDYFADELKQLQPLQALGLVDFKPGHLFVTATGWYVVRALAMVFDSHLHTTKAQAGNEHPAKQAAAYGGATLTPAVHPATREALQQSRFSRVL